jgi:hypothetical protein
MYLTSIQKNSITTKNIKQAHPKNSQIKGIGTTHLNSLNKKNQHEMLDIKEPTRE